MIDEVTLQPIATVVGGRIEPIDDDWGEVEASIVLDDRFSEDAIAGLDAFSHVDVIFVFHLVTDDKIQSGARRPRGRDDWPLVGVFAQRNKARPNRIGVHDVPAARGRRAHDARAGPRRDRRHPSARPQTARHRLWPARRGPRARLGEGVDGGLLVKVYLEAGAKKVFACSLDWPGWCRSGKDEALALETLEAYADRYAIVAKRAKVPFKVGAVDVVERLEGNATTDFGAPAMIASADHERLTPKQAERLAALLDASWKVFDDIVKGAPQSLRKGPRGGGR